MRFSSKKIHKKQHLTKISGRILTLSLASALIFNSASSLNAAVYLPSENLLLKSTAQKISILEASGDLESAYVEWKALSNAAGYNVYYKSASDSKAQYNQLDSNLIRKYKDYIRADIPGLKSGKYIIKIVPVINNKEDLSKAADTSILSVAAHTREGFAFSSHSPMGTGSGGYLDDGTSSKNAQIIYISSGNVNTVTLDVITDSKNTTSKAVGLADILTKRQKGYDKRPLIIRFIGTIKNTDIKGLNSSGYLQLKGIYNVTLEGIGEDATFYGFGLLVRNAHNVEVRNLGFMLFPDDAISLDTGNENIWIHNNDIFYGKAGSDSDQAKGDGSADVKGKSNYVTISYNHFFDSGKSSLCGMSDTENFYVTYHHNWYDHSDSRHPRIRVGSVHIYNNYFDGNSKYGVGITKGGSAFVEANYFRNTKYPMLISLQGTDIYGGSKGTFSGEAGGMIKSYNNIIQGAARLVYHTQDTREFDAYLASSRNEKVPASYKTVSGSNTYNNFDTSALMYDYSPDAPEDVENLVTNYAGRVNGGDFSWKFTLADDTDYGVNKALMSAILKYTSGLVSIGGSSIPGTPPVDNEETLPPSAGDDTNSGTDSDDSSNGNGNGDSSGGSSNGNGNGDSSSGSSSGNGNGNSSGDSSNGGSNGDSSDDSSNDEAAGSVTHNFTASGKESDFFSIKGNLSASKGTVNYRDLTLTQCLKIESSTNIGFTTLKDSTLTLVFNPDFNGSVLIDGVKVTAKSGIVTIKLKPGRHTLAKSNSASLYFMELSYEHLGSSDSGENNGSTNNPGNTGDSNSGTTNPDKPSDSITPVSAVHNFTTDGKTSSVFSINGNLSASKGSVKYNGLTLKQCLKLESSTAVSFTSAKDSKLTLVFNSNFNGTVLINNTKYTAKAGIINLELKPGKYTLKKSDIANLFYMSLI